MKKIGAFLSRPALLPLWGVLAAALYGYALYAFRYEFLDWSSLPLVGFYAGLAGISFAAVWAVFAHAIRPKRAWLGFLGGLAGFEAALWITLTVVNVNGQFNRKAVDTAFLIVLPLFAASCLLAYLVAAKRGAKKLNRAAAALLSLVYAAASFLPLFPSEQDLKYFLNFEAWPDFEPLSAVETVRTEEERAFTEKWFFDNVLSETPVYGFTLDGEPFDPARWAFAAPRAAASRRGGKTWTVSASHRDSGLALRVEATLYRENGVCEWTVYIKNTGDASSPVIGSLNALQATLPTGSAALYCSRGSHDAAADFTMMRARSASRELTFSATDGRSSDAYMPYFNFCGETRGAVLAIGWTGQWEAVTKGDGDGVHAAVRQQILEAYLLPGEEIRTPLVSLGFYNGKNPVKGFNLFRDWVLDCVYPENTPYVLNALDVLFVSHTRTAAEIEADLETYRPEVLEKVDNLWMDAGWYDGCVEGWHDGVGNWKTSAARFPDGIRGIAELAAERNAGLVLWYEPERLAHGSYLYETGLAHPRWTVDLAPEDEGNDRIMWNLAEDGARDFLAAYIGDSLKSNGVSVYRQDFNYSPLEYWRYADDAYYGGRAGICENRYVTNLYAYLDALFEMNPGLILDNCAAGGRRLDLEMTRRGIPLWRSDYNCSVHGDTLEATQAHTYGLSFWLPVTGVNIYLQDEYSAISSIYGGNLFTIDSGDSPYFGRYDAVREAMVKPFYPSTCAGTDPRGVTVMQYGDADSGYVLLYQHAKADLTKHTLRLGGLDPAAEYATSLVGREDVPAHAYSGAALQEGVRWEVAAKGAAAYVLYYERTN